MRDFYLHLQTEIHSSQFLFHRNQNHPFHNKKQKLISLLSNEYLFFYTGKGTISFLYLTMSFYYEQN